MSPDFMYGPRTSYRWRSEPQIADEVILTMASVGSWITGSGTSSTLTDRFPCHVSALMPAPSVVIQIDKYADQFDYCLFWLR